MKYHFPKNSRNFKTFITTTIIQKYIIINSIIIIQKSSNINDYNLFEIIKTI